MKSQIQKKKKKELWITNTNIFQKKSFSWGDKFSGGKKIMGRLL